MKKVISCIDVSYCQVGVDYKKVKASGIDAVIIRAGYGRETYQKDSEFETHYKNAKNAGLKIGAYWYSYADSVADAKQEAKACLACIKGKSFDMPVYFDMEDSSQVRYGKTTLTNMATAFCDAIINDGYRAGVYANLNWFSNYLDYNKLKSKYSIWLAQYNSYNQLDCDIWQNSSVGKINGISGNVDTNVVFNNDVYSTKTTTNTPIPTVTKPATPDIEYAVRAGGKWLPFVKNLTDYAGIRGQAITDIAVRATKGSVKYRVHERGGEWLPYVTGCNIKDVINGYAGRGTVIDAVEIIYYTPNDIVKAHGYLFAKYRVSPLSSNYYDYQLDNKTDNGQDGYAGCFGKSIDRLQVVLD